MSSWNKVENQREVLAQDAVDRGHSLTKGRGWQPFQCSSPTSVRLILITIADQKVGIYSQPLVMLGWILFVAADFLSCVLGKGFMSSLFDPPQKSGLPLVKGNMSSRHGVGCLYITPRYTEGPPCRPLWVWLCSICFERSLTPWTHPAPWSAKCVFMSGLIVSST